MNILYINACVRKDSRTNELAQYVLSKLNGDIEEVNLDFEKIQPLYKDQLELRDSLIKACKDANIKLVLPEKVYCTDNAAMIGAEGYLQYLKGNFADLELNAKASVQLS